MIVEDIWFDLKDGRKALLRSPKEEDIPGTLEYLKISAGETDFIMRYPEECEKYTYDGERRFLKTPAPTQTRLFSCAWWTERWPATARSAL